MLPPVHAEEHNRAYLQEVLDYFLQERAEAYAAGAAPYPLGERGRGGRASDHGGRHGDCQSDQVAAARPVVE